MSSQRFLCGLFALIRSLFTILQRYLDCLCFLCPASKSFMNPMSINIFPRPFLKACAWTLLSKPPTRTEIIPWEREREKPCTMSEPIPWVNLGWTCNHTFPELSCIGSRQFLFQENKVRTAKNRLSEEDQTIYTYTKAWRLYRNILRLTAKKHFNQKTITLGMTPG